MSTNDFADKIRELRLSQGLTLEQVGNVVGVGKSTVRKWETGLIANMRRDKIAKLAEALNTTPAYLMGWDEAADTLPSEWLEHFDGDIEAAVKAYRAMEEDRAREFSLPAGALPITRQRVPMLGTIHAGEPTFADSDFDSYVEVGAGVRCDFALRVAGDSMINARILDGDIVFVRQQDTVNDGEIAAVLIDDDATLKRVRYLPGNMLMLQPENPKYQPIVIGGSDETRNVRILGKAVAFQSDVR
jgi:repressor LexA